METTAPARSQLEMLRRVTRSMATTHDLSTILRSIATALVEHGGASVARVFLYLADDECEICRAGRPAEAVPADGERGLHLSASAGILGTRYDGHDHYIPLSFPNPLSTVARERLPFLTGDLIGEGRTDVTPEILARYHEYGIVSAGACPLDFRGELLGVIGMLSRRRFDPKEFALLGIFADQAALAIKSARMFTEVERYRDRLQEENAYLQEEIRAEHGFEQIVGESPALRAVLRKVKQVAPVETTVLLTGETGVGKELVARAIHALSPRASRALVKVNCGAISPSLVESELFGHERGAFTGALQRRIGRFELADKGTLFLDECGELPADTQVKLLRVLQEGELERVGGTRPITVDVRLIAATNRDLEHEVDERRFRADLFYRLNVFPVRIPPLRERRADIAPLVRYFLAHFRRRLGKPLRGVTKEGMELLERYDWPGNIRELQNVVERACVLATGPMVDVADALGGASADASTVEAPIATLDEHERQQIRRALAATHGRVHGRDGAAALLGINASTLRSRMQKHGLSARGVS
ncbi:sigma-54 factor interaction domain-containing protein (plasmid) [Gemmatirosa kalamazoonensis]|uniref:Sigma-54 factor interaction domain-containing protein n=1 Tax=Gemmatirosa kalamazoonensis TaxID=861299 RepID=W0RRR0_9BACT|nr:sigma 54-interacting transcriptional regulator [Gemmatirosa kalamazoonensis]AHG93010.1 sigma-54 factor interaction domain-containing protein [Gemmatirosa kalamazoonensis]